MEVMCPLQKNKENQDPLFQIEYILQIGYNQNEGFSGKTKI